MITEAIVLSDGMIHFPPHFIEGYAYLLKKFYCDQAGCFYDKYIDAFLSILE